MTWIYKHRNVSKRTWSNFLKKVTKIKSDKQTLDLLLQIVNHFFSCNSIKAIIYYFKIKFFFYNFYIRCRTPYWNITLTLEMLMFIGICYAYTTLKKRFVIENQIIFLTFARFIVETTEIEDTIQYYVCIDKLLVRCFIIII